MYLGVAAIVFLPELNSMAAKKLKHRLLANKLPF